MHSHGRSMPGGPAGNASWRGRRSLKWHGASVEGAPAIAADRRGDDRGFFARLFCERDFAAAGLASRFAQINKSRAARHGTLRRLHNCTMKYMANSCAHGFMTLKDKRKALYLVSAPYAPELERGLRFDDPWIGIRWPLQPVEMSAKDRPWPRFIPAAPEVQRLRGLCRPVGGTTGGQSCAS